MKRVRPERLRLRGNHPGSFISDGVTRCSRIFIKTVLYSGERGISNEISHHVSETLFVITDKSLRKMLTRHNSNNTINLNKHVITENWLQMVLSEHYSETRPNSKVIVNSFEVTKGSDSSEAALSDIITLSVEADVDGEKKVLDFIIKLLPLDPFSRYFVKEAQFDLREIKFYTQLVPDLLIFQRENLRKDSSAINLPVPECYMAKYVPIDFSDTPPSTPHETNESVIVLEDLKKKGYQNVSFKKGLSLQQAESAFEAVSKLHALSLALKVSENTPLNEKYDFLFQTEKASVSYQQLLERGLPQLIHFLEKQQGMKEVIDCLNSIRPKTRYLTQTLLNPKEPVALITHIDFWSNNLLFKDDQCLILDWQMVAYSRPTNDLALLIISSLPAAVRRQHSSHLLDLYWEHFKGNCLKLDLDVEKKLNYTREDLSVDYKSSQLLALLLCIGSIDVALRDAETEERLLAALADLHEDGVLSLGFINQL